MKTLAQLLALAVLILVACTPPPQAPPGRPAAAAQVKPLPDSLEPWQREKLARWEAEKATRIGVSISRWRITRIPDVVFEMPQLRSLTLAYLPLDSLDARIGDLGALEELELINVSIRFFPTSITRLHKLRVLYLSETCISPQMWEQIAQLPNLQVLHMNHCGFDLPTTGPVPPRLDTIYMTGGIADGSQGQLAGVARIKTLRYLDISGHTLGTFPPDIRLMPHLRHLEATHNSFHRLPDWLPELDSLQTLHVGVESYREELALPFPEVLFEMKQLRDLTVNGICTSVADRFGELPGLRRLGLHLDLTELPPSVATLDLEHLDLFLNKLSTLPPGIQQMRRLRKLDLGSNEFGPDYLHAYFASADYPELRYLSLRVNHLGTFPTAFCACDKLTCLDIEECQLEEEPPCLPGFKNLRGFENRGNPYLTRPHEVSSLGTENGCYGEL